MGISAYLGHKIHHAIFQPKWQLCVSLPVAAKSTYWVQPRDGPIIHLCRYANTGLCQYPADTKHSYLCCIYVRGQVQKKLPICRYFRYRYWYWPIPSAAHELAFGQCFYRLFAINNWFQPLYVGTGHSLYRLWPQVANAGDKHRSIGPCRIFNFLTSKFFGLTCPWLVLK